MSEADARKGSFTNAFKKAVAFMGPGRAAYRGTIDDDHVPADGVAPSSTDTVRTTARESTNVPATPRAATVPPTAQADTARNRLSSKQYAAIRSLSRTAGYDERGFKEHVRKRFGVEAAYLSKIQASALIGELLAASNGHDAREAG